jgi:hypothetical protein
MITRSIAALALSTAVAVSLVASGGCKQTSERGTVAEGNLAKMTVQKIAFEAYPQWAATHPDKACPASIDDLKDALGSETSLTDPWGHPYKMLCGANLPKGARGFAVSSAGPDGADGTADDIKSWE